MSQFQTILVASSINSTTRTVSYHLAQQNQNQCWSYKVKCKSHLPNTESGDNLIPGDKLRTPPGQSHRPHSLVNSYLLWQRARHLSCVRRHATKWNTLYYVLLELFYFSLLVNRFFFCDCFMKKRWVSFCWLCYQFHLF